MNIKTIIQAILFFIIILFVSFFLFEYIFKTELKETNKQETVLPSSLDENLSNSIENIEYISKDSLGNTFIIKAKLGEILDNDKNIILMKKVEAMVLFKNSENIIINASSAIYNTISYDTNFKEDIFIKYGEHEITCNSVDMQFKDHKIKLYDDINYNYISSELLADTMEIDLLNKDFRIYMNDQNTKVKAMYKDNVSN
jgi:hypothetical protein